MQINDEIAKATQMIAGESGSPAFAGFMKLFDAMIKRQQFKLETAEGKEVYRIQGTIAILREMIKHFSSVREVKYANKDGSYF